MAGYKNSSLTLQGICIILELVFSVCTINALEIQLSYSNQISFVLQSNITSSTTSSADVASWYNESTLVLTTLEQRFAVGRVLYGTPIMFINETTGKVFSFTTYLSFQIITKAGETAGDGFAFFIAPNMSIPVNGSGSTLGLTSLDAAHLIWANTDPSRHLLALEFDTFNNGAAGHDPSNSHIAIDINGLNSSVIYNSNDSFNDLNLHKDSTLYAWLHYDGDNSMISVWASVTPQRPSSQILNYSVDLSKIFHESMYVGLSASTGADTQTVNVFDWKFTIFNDSTLEDTLLNPADAPSPSPSPFSATDGSDVQPISKSHSSRYAIAIAIPIVVIAIIVAVVVLWCCRRSRWKQKLLPPAATTKAEAALANIYGVRRYSYRELKRATNGFSEEDEIGEGGFSVVYRARLLDGSVVAVKKLKDGIRKEEEFAAEVLIISKIRHRNLMQLQGWCYEKREAMLVYNFMPKGSLESYIFEDKRLAAGNSTLDGDKRMEILLGVAAALEYLHEGLGERVLHRDVKAANVMLADDWEAKLGDFGLVKFIRRDKHGGCVTMTNVAGTPGYMAPEVAFTGKANDKADVFSFGMLSLEVACGRRCVVDSEILSAHEKSIVDWVWRLHQGGNVLQALDSALQLRYAENSTTYKWRCVLHLGLLCCFPNAEARPSMRLVRHALRENVLWPLPDTWPHLAYTSSAASSDTVSVTDLYSSSGTSNVSKASSTSQVDSSAGETRSSFSVISAR